MVTFQERKESSITYATNLDQCNVFSFGIGSSVNRYLIEGVAKAGMGEPFIVTQEAEAPGDCSQIPRIHSDSALNRHPDTVHRF